MGGGGALEGVSGILNKTLLGLSPDSLQPVGAAVFRGMKKQPITVQQAREVSGLAPASGSLQQC